MAVMGDRRRGRRRGSPDRRLRWAAPAAAAALTACALAASAQPAGAAGAAATSLTIAPSRGDFGRLAVASAPSAPIVFEIANAGVDGIDVGALALAGPDRRQFRLTVDFCSDRPVAAGATCTITVLFDPSSAGAKHARLVVPAGDAALTAPLAGTAFGAPRPPSRAVLEIVSRRLVIHSRGRARLHVRCRTVRASRCVGSLTMRARGAGVVARRRYAVAPGRRRLTVSLSRRGRRTLARHATLRARLRATSRPPGGGRPRRTSARITLISQRRPPAFTGGAAPGRSLARSHLR